MHTRITSIFVLPWLIVSVVVQCADHNQQSAGALAATRPGPMPDHYVNKLTNHDVHVYAERMHSHNAKAIRTLLKTKDVPRWRRLKAGIQTTLNGTTRPRHVETTDHLIMQEMRDTWKSSTKGQDLKTLKRFVENHGGSNRMYTMSYDVKEAANFAKTANQLGKPEKQPRLHESKDALRRKLEESELNQAHHRGAIEYYEPMHPH